MESRQPNTTLLMLHIFELISAPPCTICVPHLRCYIWSYIIYAYVWHRNTPILGLAKKESFSHFLSTCRKFKHARTAAAPTNNRVCTNSKVLASSLLELVPTAIVLQAGRQLEVSDSDAAAVALPMSHGLGRWQPYFMAKS